MKRIKSLISTLICVAVSMALFSSCSHEEGVSTSLNINDEYNKIHEQVKSQFDNLKNKIILTRNMLPDEVEENPVCVFLLDHLSEEEIESLTNEVQLKIDNEELSCCAMEAQMKLEEVASEELMRCYNDVPEFRNNRENSMATAPDMANFIWNYDLTDEERTSMMYYIDFLDEAEQEYGKLRLFYKNATDAQGVCLDNLGDDIVSAATDGLIPLIVGHNLPALGIWGFTFSWGLLKAATNFNNCMNEVIKNEGQ